MNTNQSYSKIFSNKRNQPKEDSKAKSKNPWKNERTKNREQKRGWNE